MNRPAFLNAIRSLFNIDGYQVPELTREDYAKFRSNPPYYLITADEPQQDAILREVEKRGVRA